MPDYRRSRVLGGTFFFTVNLLNRRSNLLVTRIDALREAVRQVRAHTPFHIDAWVVLPNHMRCLWTLPEGANFSGRLRAIEIAFVKSLSIGEPRSRVMTRRGKRGIWLGDTGSTRSAMIATSRRVWDYTHFNPVKHGLVAHPADWAIRPFIAASVAGYILAVGGAVAMNRSGAATPPKKAEMRQPVVRPRGVRTGHDEGGMRYAVPPYACCLHDQQISLA